MAHGFGVSSVMDSEQFDEEAVVKALNLRNKKGWTCKGEGKDFQNAYDYK